MSRIDDHAAGFADGFAAGYSAAYRDLGMGKATLPAGLLLNPQFNTSDFTLPAGRQTSSSQRGGSRPKRKPSAWNKFVKANSKKRAYIYQSGAKKGKLNLKKMAVAWRKTPAGRKSKRR